MREKLHFHVFSRRAASSALSALRRTYSSRVFFARFVSCGKRVVISFGQWSNPRPRRVELAASNTLESSAFECFVDNYLLLSNDGLPECLCGVRVAIRTAVKKLTDKSSVFPLRAVKRVRQKTHHRQALTSVRRNRSNTCDTARFQEPVLALRSFFSAEWAYSRMFGSDTDTQTHRVFGHRC